MNRAIRRVGIGVVALVLILVLQLTYLTIVDANNLKRNPHNVRALLSNANRPRGNIVTADGTLVAQSQKVSDGTVFKYLREYPTKDLFAQTVGYQSFVFGSTGVENTYNNALLGRENQLNLNNIPDIFSGKQTIGTVVLSMRADAQRLAQQLLGFQRGSVVLLDVKTGGVLAMYSNPSYDPNPFVSHNNQLAQAAFTAVQSNPDHPALPRAYRERYPPGSSFKTVTASVALGDGVATPSSTFPVRTQLQLPQSSNTLKNFGGESCGGTLVASFTVSCNTTFGQLGLQLGDQFVPGMAKFGIGQAPPVDISPGAVPSVGPPAGSFASNQPLFAFAGIGQGAVAVTPLQMALVAEGIANGGVILQPHVVSEIRDNNDKLIRRIDPSPWMTATTPQVAQAVTQMMVQVVQNGTGTAAQINGVTVAGKTGTAQSAPNQAPHAWFVAFAPAEAPRFAVAVLVEHGGGNLEATGGRVAAPIAAQMLKLVLGVK
ncbi:MAG TPA: penicillin-binding transpeptidase domain-containing protein [Acidimicrobiia bacterium]|nr:penicillin-binding transpeptidase domain-containing protein [Acidimicrobiia bacterium]